MVGRLFPYREGTDVKLADRDKGYDLMYHPNFQWGVTETWFNGTFHVAG